jgi:hypothetical protein
MESNDSVKFKENKKRFKMSLLFIQTKELRKLYNSQFKKIPRKYHLINKNWLDSYKNSNNYNYAIDMFNNYNDWEDYSDFKKKIIKYFPIEDSKFTVFGVGDALDNILNFSLNKEKIPNFNLSFPNDCELVREEFFKDCSKGSLGFPVYDIYIGNKLIIIQDSETQNVVFLCSLVESQDNINNFLIRVNCLLAFDCESYMKNEIEQIIANQSLNNYLNYRKINLNVYDQQLIENQDGKRLGILFIIKNKQSTEKNNQNNLIIQKNVELNNEQNSNDNIFNKEINQNALRNKNNNDKINTKTYDHNNHNDFSQKNLNNNGNINNFNINNGININNSINSNNNNNFQFINNFNNFERNNYNNGNINNKSVNSFNDMNTNAILNNVISPPTNNINKDNNDNPINQMDSIFNTNNNQNNNHFRIQNNNNNSNISSTVSSGSAIPQNNSSNLFNNYNQEIYSNNNYMNNLSDMYNGINFNNNNSMSNNNNNYYNNNLNFMNNQQNFNGNNMSNTNNINMNMNNLFINNSDMSTQNLNQ